MDRLDKEDDFYSKGDESLAQVFQRGGGCPVPGEVQVRLDGTLNSRSSVGEPWPLKGLFQLN